MMKVETILRITREHEFGMARNAKESLCLLISRAVRSGDIDGLAELIGDDEKIIARTAINAYQNKNKTHHTEYNEEVA